MPFIIFFTNIPPGTDKKVPPPVCVPLFPAVPSPACRAFGGPGYLVQRCINITVMSTRYSRQHRVVDSQRCHHIASLIRLMLTRISSTHYATLYQDFVAIHSLLTPHRCPCFARWSSLCRAGLQGFL